MDMSKEIEKKSPGQPKKFSFDYVKNKGEEYFYICDENNCPYTITGLCLHIGFYGKQQLHEYQGYEEFSDLIKIFRTKVENSYEMRLYGTTATGAIFALKNMGWKDNKELEHSGYIKNSEPQIIFTETEYESNIDSVENDSKETDTVK